MMVGIHPHDTKLANFWDMAGGEPPAYATETP